MGKIVQISINILLFFKNNYEYNYLSNILFISLRGRQYRYDNHLEFAQLSINDLEIEAMIFELNED